MKRQLIYHTHVKTNQDSNIQVNVRSSDIKTTCHLNRVSRDGLTLSCDASTLHSLMPNKASVAPKDPIALKTNFTLSQNIDAQCRVVFARRLSKDQFILELKFVDISEQHMSYLNDFIEESLSCNKNKAKTNKPSEVISEAQSIEHITLDNDYALRKVA